MAGDEGHARVRLKGLFNSREKTVAPYGRDGDDQQVHFVMRNQLAADGTGKTRAERLRS